MPQETAPKAPCVLVVEDRPGVRHLMVVALRREGIDVESAATAEDAWVILRTHLPDVVVLDLLLPGAGGERLAHVLRTTPATRHIPVIVVSGLEAGPAVVRAVGAQEFLAKPFDVRDLVERVRRHLSACARQAAMDGAP